MNEKSKAAYRFRWAALFVEESLYYIEKPHAVLLNIGV